MICSRRLYKGNSYEICLPLTDTGVTMVRFYTRGDVIIEKEPEISGDSMCFSFMPQELASLEDGVLRYQIVTEYETVDTNSPYVIVTPGDYSGETLDDLIEDAFDSGYTAGLEDCSGGSCEHIYESGYTDGYSSGYTDGSESVDCSPFYMSGVTDGYSSGYTSGKTDGLEEGFDDGYTSGHTDGYDEGYDSGYTRGYDSGFNSGYTDGSQDGFEDGFGEGYSSGFTDGVDSVVCTGYTQEDLDNAYSSGYTAGMEDCSGVISGYSSLPLTFDIMVGGTIKWKAMYGSAPTTIQFRKNDGAWSSITATETGSEISVVGGDKVEFKGNNPMYGNDSFSGSTCTFKLYGNIMSLIDATDFATMTSFPSGGTSVLGYLFSNCTGLTDASNLVLPATTLEDSCYERMFENCTSLAAAPELPATTLAIDCYDSMFRFCRSLILAPELPATTLPHYCYQRMFEYCDNLIYIKCLATDISGDNCLGYWADDVRGSGTFVKDANTTWPTGISGIPSGWTVVDAT